MVIYEFFIEATTITNDKLGVRGWISEIFVQHSADWMLVSIDFNAVAHSTEIDTHSITVDYVFIIDHSQMAAKVL